MYIVDYNENSTAQYIYKQTVIHTTLSNRLYKSNNYCCAVSCGEMYCIGYSLFDNLVSITACLYMYCAVLFSL